MKRVLYLLMALLFFPLAQAVTVQPSSFHLQAYTFKPLVFEFNVTNNLNVSIFNLNFTRLADFDFPSGINLTSNQTIQLSANITTSTAYQSQPQNLLYFYVRGSVPVDPITANVTITPTGYDPANISIFEGSTILWTNTDTIPHSVSGALFNTNVSPNSTFSFTFNAPGNYSYFDVVTNYQGIVRVLEKAPFEFVHDSTLDVTLTYQVDSTLVETVLEIEPIISNTTIPYDKTRQGVLRVRNVGNQTARTVRPGATQWVTYNIDVLDLLPAQEQFIVFEITPFVTNPNETGLDYNISLYVIANNTLRVEKNITVTVPRVLEITNTTNICDVFAEKKKLCDAFPTSPLCASEPVVQYVDRIIYKSPPLQANLSQEDLVQLHRNYILLKDDLQKMFNYQRSATDSIHNDTVESRASSARTESQVGRLNTNTEKQASDLRNIAILFFTSLIVGVVVLGIGWGSIRLYGRYKKNKAIAT